MPHLTTDFSAIDDRPYFLWDETRTVGQFRAALQHGSREDWARDIGKLMREARDADVWKFTTPREAYEHLALIDRYLGRRRAFWHYLLNGWKADGVLG